MRKELIKKIVVRGPNWVGDAVMCEPALSAVRELFPNAEITLLVKPAIAELLRGYPGIDRVLVYEVPGSHAGVFGKWTLAGTLREAKFDIAILFQNAFGAALLAFLAGIPNRYGYARDGRSFLLTDPIAVPRGPKSAHQVQYFWELLRPLGPVGGPRPPRLYLSDPEEHAALQRLGLEGIANSDFLVGVNPGSMYGGAKRWLPERFAEATDRLVTESGVENVRVVIVGAKGEEALGHTIAQQMQAKPLVLSGQTTIRELMAVIKRCRLFITNDTGPMHIAAAFGVPVVAVFGPTDWYSTAPFGGRQAIVRHQVECSPCLLRECPIDHRCMTRVTVDEVLQASLEQMGAAVAGQHKRDTPGRNHFIRLSPTPLRGKGMTVILDRDGTLNRDTGYAKSPEEIELLPGVVEAVARLKREGARVVLITNQSGIARGFLTANAVETIHLHLRQLLEVGGGSLDAIYYCPHHPEDGCLCRKPGTQLVEQAAADLDFVPSGAYVVGDQKRDVELARRIGARSVLVTTGPTSVQALADLEGEQRGPDCVAENLLAAVDWILKDVDARPELNVSR